MSLPPGLQTVAVSGSFQHPDGTPGRGTVRFTPTPAVLTAPDDETIVLGSVVGTADDTTGEFTVNLLATDAEGVNPSGWTYRVEERWYDAPGRTYYLSLPAAEPEVDLAQVAPAAEAGGEYTVVAGPTGPAGAQGPKGDMGPVGEQGVAGPTGPQGAQGEPGPQGDVGANGTAGATGPQGLKGDPGASGATGPQGPKGETGPAGADGSNADAEAYTDTAVSAHVAAADPHADRAYADTQIGALSALTQIVAKAADETRTSTVTVADDAHLYVSLEANSVYRFACALLFDGPETADATLTFTAPSGSSGGWVPYAGTLGTTGPDGSASLKVAARQFGSNSDIGVMASSATLAGLMVLPHGIVVTGSTPGLLRLRWSQQTSNASAVTLKQGSTLEVIKLSGAGPAATGINNGFPDEYPSDSGLLAWTYSPDMAGHVTAQSSAGVAGRITLVKLILRKGITWSNLWFGLSGVDTGASLSGCYLGVYNAAGTLVGSTADISASLMTGATAKSMTLAAPFTAPPGEYFIAMLLNGSWTTNSLTFKASGAGVSVNANLAPPRLKYSNLLSGQTALPSSLDLTQQTTTLINTGWASQWYGVN